jgi:hypothetical protein
VNQENATSLESNNQILAATFHALDDLASQLGGHLERVERANEATVEDLDSLEPPACERGLEASAYGLYLGQFGHRRRR